MPALSIKLPLAAEGSRADGRGVADGTQPGLSEGFVDDVGHQPFGRLSPQRLLRRAELASGTSLRTLKPPLARLAAGFDRQGLSGSRRRAWSRLSCCVEGGGQTRASARLLRDASGQDLPGAVPRNGRGPGPQCDCGESESAVVCSWRACLTCGGGDAACRAPSGVECLGLCSSGSPKWRVPF
jgi:hypothetical protein